MAAAAHLSTSTPPQGTWKGVWGSDGIHVPNLVNSPPAYITGQTFAGQSTHTWANSTTDVRAVQKPNPATDRIASTWFSATSFTVTITTSSSTTEYQLGIYLLDWDRLGRDGTVEVLDPGNGDAVLVGPLTVGDNRDGKWLRFHVVGTVKLRFTKTGAQNVAVSGLFFDPSGNPATPSLTQTAQGTDSFTVETSAFSDEPGDTHAATQWLIETLAGVPVFDSGADSTNLTERTFTSADGLAANTLYVVRARHQDNNGNWSQYGSLTVGTGTAVAQRGTCFNEYPNGDSLADHDWTVFSGTPTSEVVTVGDWPDASLSPPLLSAEFCSQRVAIHPPASGNHILLYDPAGSDFLDGELYALTPATSAGGGAIAQGIVWRVSSSGFYAFVRMTGAQDHFQLYKVVGGTWTQLGTNFTGDGTAAEPNFRLLASMFGGEIRVDAWRPGANNGTLFYTDATPLPAGGVGIIAVNPSLVSGGQARHNFDLFSYGKNTTAPRTAPYGNLPPPDIPGEEPPTAPTLSASALSASTIRLTISAGVNATTRRIYRGAAGFTPGPGNLIATVTPSTTQYDNTGLNHGTQYCYRVIDSNATDSATSNEACATTLAGTAPGEVTIPGQPTGALGSILVQDPDGDWQDLLELARGEARNWVRWAETDEYIDNPGPSAVVDFWAHREPTQSLSPLMESSEINRTNLITTFAPLLRPGAPLRIQIADPTVAPGFHLVFDGLIDEINMAQWDGTLSCVGLYQRLQDLFIQWERNYASGPIETISQQILNDNGAGVALFSLNGDDTTPFNPADSPGWVLEGFPQARVPVLEAVRAKWQMIGWDVRYLPHPDGGINPWRLTAFEPPRDKTAATGGLDDTFGSNEVSAIQRWVMSQANVRNFGRGFFYLPSGARSMVEHDDPASIEKYGLRYFEISEDATSNIDSPDEMEAMLVAILNDLSEPPAQQERELPLKWQRRVFDLVRFLPNYTHFDTAQDQGVLRVRHRLASKKYGGHKTFLTTGGRVAGGFETWLKKERRTRISLGSAPGGGGEDTGGSGGGGGEPTVEVPNLQITSLAPLDGNCDLEEYLTNRIQIQLTNAPADHTLAVLRAIQQGTPGPGPYSTIASGLATSTAQYDDEITFYVHDKNGGVATRYYYRVQLIRTSDSAVIAVSQTPSAVSYVKQCVL